MPTRARPSTSQAVWNALSASSLLRCVSELASLQSGRTMSHRSFECTAVQPAKVAEGSNAMTRTRPHHHQQGAAGLRQAGPAMLRIELWTLLRVVLTRSQRVLAGSDMSLEPSAFAISIAHRRIDIESSCARMSRPVIESLPPTLCCIFHLPTQVVR
jgi:hypothetical protein